VPRQYANAKATAQNGIEKRILTERIKEYRKDFHALYDRVERCRAGSRKRLDEYHAQWLEHTDTHVNSRSNACELNEEALCLEAQLASLRDAAQTTNSLDEQKVASLQIARATMELDEVCMARDHYSGEAASKVNLVMLYTVLCGSMQRQFNLLASQARMLQERGTYIHQLLHDYENGGDMAELAALKKEIHECAMVRDRLLELDREYTSERARETAAMSMPDTALRAAFENTVKEGKKVREQSQNAFHQCYSASLRMSLGQS
jgi:hypothetical protein